MIPPLLRTLATGSIVLVGGAIAISALTASVFRRQALIKKEKFGKLCLFCRGKGFYRCKLCKGNGTIRWSPLYDPVFVNPCVCPTCDGHKLEQKHGVYSKLDACTFVVNVYNGGNILSIVTDSSPDATHVAGMAAAFHPEEPLLNADTDAAPESDVRSNMFEENLKELKKLVHQYTMNRTKALIARSNMMEPL
ncbi:hypothetical protein HAX54_048190 [Datura stramonium]|uniref:Uncharacterized protein n=1 Tax=Datura stramonium TaxID=4076 RepID=A0ABS8WNR1_DATST|nr:hypothetical protein [Datura stramonium]